MNFKKNLWKYATAIVVGLLILNPELAQLALFIDALGLEFFLLLLEVQILALMTGVFNARVKPFVSGFRLLCAHYYRLFSWRNVREDPQSLMLAVPGQAACMSALVLSCAVSVACNWP